MRAIAAVAAYALVILVGAAAVLLLGWLLALPLGWLFGFSPFHAFAMGLAALLILAVFSNAMTMQSASESPWHWFANPVDDLELDATEVSESEPGTWFSPCPCGSGKQFARCCGKKAFSKRNRA